jgi:hypothetical protein
LAFLQLQKYSIKNLNFGLEGVDTYIRVDDIIVYGKNKEEHDERLRKVLQRESEKNIKCNKSKCKFNKSKVNFLGHEITSLEVKPDYNKIKIIK